MQAIKCGAQGKTVNDPIIIGSEGGGRGGSRKD